MGLKEDMERIGYRFEVPLGGRGTMMRGFDSNVGCELTGEAGYQVCATLELRALEAELADEHDEAVAARAASLRKALKLPEPEA